MNGTNRASKAATASKHRLGLTAEQIDILTKITKRAYAAEATPELYTLLGILSTRNSKIQFDLCKPDYTPVADEDRRISKPVEISLESLGAQAQLEPEEIDPASFSSKTLYWEACYEKYVTDLDSCSLTEIDAANEHRYINELMTEEEMAKADEALFTEAARIEKQAE